MLKFIAVKNTTCACSFGTMPCLINISLPSSVLINGLPCVKCSNAVPNVNISSFGLCTCPANPAVIKTAFGIIPATCVPQIAPPQKWITTKNNMQIENEPICVTGDTCVCMYGGIIKIETSVQSSVSV